MKRSTLSARHLLAPLLAALVLAGCATAPAEYAAPVEVPAKFKEASAVWAVVAPAESQDRGTWWKVFADPALDALVERAGAANTSIQEAASRLAQARAALGRTQADRLPQVGLGSGAVRQAGANTANGAAPATLTTAGATLSWELDLFGRLARANDAATLDAQSRAALLQSTRLLVQSEVAQTYLSLRAIDVERALVRETVTAYEGTLRVTQRRHQAGDIAELDVARVESELAATQSEALALDRRRAELEHALAVLVGDAASTFALTPGDWTTALPAIPAGIPATVLARRPDVSAAQSGMLAAQARLGVARAAWFPNVSLTAAGGYASPELGDLFKWTARAWSVGALLSLPIFDGGKRQAGIDDARAQLEGASASYRGQVLTAFREVEDQLSSLRLLQEQAQAQARAVTSASRATVLSESRYRNGMDSQLELLDARRSELRNRRQALQVRAGQYQATVALIRALGGGWGTPS
ncbi:efflux transporter outer membrane subunit [Caenimonas aquaedulcis]|uniref:Efflux transporter outer membrane subunit n=1 Tax=Caenimonas aquaedulcis TaxID=2793270 RepID=A0A931H714_9BURK|nr:efflux transporter outer membrane subunit [Caenimonas aquaedulcis]MBG9389856.1 efflux transporter outer membrane subunit [Caenimonas aquaedulcis]